MKVQHILGADLSKNWIDLVVHSSGAYLRIENNAAGFKQLVKWLNHQKLALVETLLVMEHTGLYSFLFEGFLHAKQIAFTKVSALAIQRSMGLQRGKSDKLDAKRIALYGQKEKESLRAEAPLDKDLQRLQLLQATRKRLVEERAGLQCSLKEYTHMGLKPRDLVLAAQRRVVKTLDLEIQKLEKEIQAAIEGNEAIAKNACLLKSIPGVGQVLAVETIVKTRNFTRFTKPKKFCCHSGTAPFEHSSGSSIKKGTRVSHLADKALKTLLDLAAKCAIQHDNELKAYYQRRLAIGKSKMSTINIVRNKIIYRMFAVVKRGTPFVENYLPAA
jgi:transposase